MEFPAPPPMPAMAELLPCDIFPMSFLAPVNPDHATDSEQRFPIAAVEAATGIAKETLRAWERRYGFPTPVRDAAGERLYSAQQLQQLRAARQLIDRGARPGQIFINGVLDDAAAGIRHSATDRGVERFADWFALLSAFRLDELGVQLQRELLRRGLPSFTSELLAPFVRAVGDAWQSGRITVAVEHAFTARVCALLQSALLSFPAAEPHPVIICATPAGERHGLGLLMAQAMLAEHGLRAIDFGVDLPVAEIAQAASASNADIVMLSFSAHFPHRQVPALLQQMASQLPSSTEIWVGGAGARTIRSKGRLRSAQKLQDIPGWVADWQLLHQLRQRSM